MSNKKENILKSLCSSLKSFRADANDSFMCPVCLKLIPLANISKISEAHIIPKAANGTVKTYLCSKCNNHFGSLQDKWFGEFINLAGNDENNIFDTKIRLGHYTVNDIQVNGEFRNDIDALKFYVHKDRNSPKTLKSLEQFFKTNPKELNFTVSFPIYKNDHLIKIGFLTAAYLMWFGAIGYSWVFQKHLKKVRQQILNPDESILPTSMLATIEGGDCQSIEPWIGIIPIGELFAPVMGFNKFLTILPPACHPHIYESISKKDFTLDFDRIRQLGIYDEPAYGPAQSLLYNDCMIVAPTTDSNRPDECPVLWVQEKKEEYQMLYPISSNEFKERSTNEDTIVNKIKFHRNV